MNKIDWVEDSTQSVSNVCEKHLKIYVQKKNNVVLNGKQCWEKTMQMDKVRA